MVQVGDPVGQFRRMVIRQQMDSGGQLDVLGAAGDAKAASQVLEDQVDKIDLLLCDVVLPGAVSGPEFAGNAIELYPKLKVVMMSGYAPDLYTHDNVPGFDETLLRKPFKRADLAKAIGSALAD